MTKATSLSDTTALRDEVVPRQVRQFGSARDGAAICDSNEELEIAEVEAHVQLLLDDNDLMRDLCSRAEHRRSRAVFFRR